MPEVIAREPSTLPPFAAGQGKGQIYIPLPEDTRDGIVRAHAIQTINADAQTLYDIFRDLPDIPRWQEYVLSVTEKSPTLSHWVFGDPDHPHRGRFEFDSEITEDVPGQTLAWRSMAEGFHQHGRVTFAPSPNGRGTEVVLTQHMAVPGGKLGVAFAGLLKRSPHQIVRENLRHVKQLAESGEIPSVVGQPNGPRGFLGSLKARLYGENNPTPPGTSSRPATRPGQQIDRDGIVGSVVVISVCVLTVILLVRNSRTTT